MTYAKYDPDGEIENSGKIIFRNFFMVADLLSPNRCHLQIAKVKNYNLNVLEVPYPALPMLFLGIFNFTVGILL